MQLKFPKKWDPYLRFLNFWKPGLQYWYWVVCHLSVPCVHQQCIISRCTNHLSKECRWGEGGEDISIRMKRWCWNEESEKVYLIWWHASSVPHPPLWLDWTVLISNSTSSPDWSGTFPTRASAKRKQGQGSSQILYLSNSPKNTAKLYGDALVWSAVFIDWLDWFELVS